MNYAGFTRPVWAWLRGDELPTEPATSFFGLPVGVHSLPGESIVRTMRAFRAGIPWSASLHSWAILDSHDSSRFSVIAGSRDRQLVGVGLQMTTPGVPMVFAGDEIGLGGEWGEDARRPMPWSRPETWDTGLFDGYRELIAMRRTSRALARGGIRYAHVSADAIAYVREASGDTVLCLATRACARSGPSAARPTRRQRVRDARGRGRFHRRRSRRPADRRAGVPCLESRVTTKEVVPGG